MEWPQELVFEFLKLYQNEPILWNTRTPEHKNKNERYDAWNRIKTKLKDESIPLKEIKKKRDYLMSTYRRLKLKIRESTVSGSGADDIYKPKWPFYNLMATFLDDVYKPKTTKSSQDLLDTIEIEEDSNDNGMQATLEKTFKVPNIVVNNKFKRSKPNKRDKIKKRSDEAYNILKNTSQKHESDTCSLYCDLLCNKLRALHENTKDIAMMEIDRIMYKLKQQDSHIRSMQCQSTIPSIRQLPYNYQTQTQVLRGIRVRNRTL